MAQNSVKKNTVYNTIKTIFGIIFPLITFPYISRVLMTDNIGKINFGSSIVSYFSLIASLGVTTYAIRECSKVKDNKEEFSNTASQILSINIISTLLAYFTLFILLLFAKSLSNYRMLICIQSLSILFSTLGADWLNTAMEDFRFITIRTIAFQVISIVLMLIIVKGPDDYMKYVVISVLASSGANVTNIIYRKRFCLTRFTTKMNIRKHLPQILLLFSLMLSQMIYVNSDITILGLVKGDYEVGLYSTSVKMYSLVNTTIASIAWVVMPKLAYLFHKKDYSEINNLLKYSLNFVIVLGIPSVCGLEVLAPHLITTFAGEAYVGATSSLRILGAAMFCSFIGGWLGNMIRLPSGQEAASLKIVVCSAILNVVLNIILIPRWGLNAAAFTTFISELFCMIIGFVFMDQNIRISGLSKMLVGPVIGGIGIVGLGVIVQRLFEQSWQIVLFTLIVSVIWYIIILFVTKNEFFLSFSMPTIERIQMKMSKER